MLRNTDTFNYYNNPIIDNAQNKFNIYANNTFQNNLNSKFNIPKSKSSLYFREEQAPRANNSPPILKYNSSSLLNNPPNHSFSVSSFPSTINVIPPNSQIPPVSINGKKTLILDIDETLVHSSFFPFIRPHDISLNMNINGLNKIIYVLKRPHVDEFLKELSNIFEIITFTASLSQYADPLLDQLDKYKIVSHRLYRHNCINIPINNLSNKRPYIINI